LSVNGHGIELPSSWLRQRRSRRGDFARLRSQTRFGGGYTAEKTVWLDYVWPVAGGTTTVDYQVGASSSDSHMTSITNDSGRAVAVSGAVSLTNAVLSPGSHGGGDEWSVAARFAGVAVDQGATVNSATFQLRCQNTWNASPNVIKFYISAQAADNAGALTATSGDLNTTARPRTTATAIVDWSSVTVDTWYSVDITSVVQEVVNRAGWANGNAIVILVDTHADTTLSEWQDFYSYDGAAASAPKLSVTYASGGGSTSPITTRIGGGSAFASNPAGRGALMSAVSGAASMRGYLAALATTSPIFARLASSSSIQAALRGRAPLALQAAGAGAVVAGLRGRGSAGARASGASHATGNLRGFGRPTANLIGASSVVAEARGRGDLRSAFVGSAAVYGYLAVLSTTSPIFARITAASALYAAARGRYAASMRLVGASIVYGRASASGGLSVRIVAAATERAAARGRGAAQARAVASGYVVAVPHAIGRLSAVDAAGAALYGRAADAVPPGIGIVTLTPTASDPDILVTVLRADVGVAATGPGPGTMARRPALATTGARPDPAISGRG